MTTAIQTVSVQALKQKMDSSEICLIDVRELDEWNEVRIPGAKHIPKAMIANEIDKHVADLNQPIYLHCRGGVRSLDAAQTLVDLGYTTIFSVDGGIIAWIQQGYDYIENAKNG